MFAIHFLNFKGSLWLHYLETKVNVKPVNSTFMWNIFYGHRCVSVCMIFPWNYHSDFGKNPSFSNYHVHTFTLIHFNNSCSPPPIFIFIKLDGYWIHLSSLSVWSNNDNLLGLTIASSFNFIALSWDE